MNMPSRNFFFWTIFIIGAIGCSIASYIYFPKALPIVDLHIIMNRTKAIESAQQLAQTQSIGPHNARVATSFNTDEKVKTFIELEHGGKAALLKIMKQDLYQPYRWIVRLFKPYEQRQAHIFFAPDGRPYGFNEELSETDKKKNLSEQSARILAESVATSAPWNISLTDYTLVESSQDKTPAERIDHSFTYEQIHETIIYRLIIVVSGDHVSKLERQIKIPESFSRKYKEMRSENENIAYHGTLLMILLYGIGGCVVGLYYLTEKRMAQFKTPFLWACAVACAIGLTIINKLPLHWMNYSTSVSPFHFLLQITIMILYNVVFLSCLFSVVFVTAEGLTRMAFPKKIQLWKLFNPSVAGSYTVLGYTIGGYLLIPFALSYLLLFYFSTTQYLGWWTPTSALFDPDILATYFPWIESIGLSLQAGLFEECLFRAIPLAGAALLGNRFGKRNLWITAAFILQALIFGAAHANYPSYPAYARLIELIIISFLFGGVYLRFGLLPSIICHFGYDVLLFALPIFASVAPGAYFNKWLVILLTLTPIWIVLAAWLRNKTLIPLSDSFLNQAWRPSAVKKESVIISEAPQPFSLTSHARILIVSFGIIGAIAWISTTQFKPDSPSFTTDRNEALQHATAFLNNKGIQTEQWTPLVNPMIDFSQIETLQKQHRFIWQRDNSLYSSFLKSYLAPPHWISRFVHFNGPLEQRAEEYAVYLNPDGSLYRYVHKLPEEMKLPSLTRDEAINNALENIKTTFLLQSESLKPVSVQAIKQPYRTDWIITYKDITEPKLRYGEKHITVTFAGNTLSDAYRSIHVPEQWSRTEDDRLLRESIIMKLCQLMIYFLLLISSFIAIKRWSSMQIKIPIFLLIILLGIFGFELFNAYQTKIFDFITSQPFYDQLFRTFGITSILLFVRAIVLAFLISFVSSAPQRFYPSFPRYMPFFGICMGICIAGMQSLLISIIPRVAPTWANYTPLRFLSSWAVAIDSLLLNYLTLTGIFLYVLIIMQPLFSGSRNKRYTCILLVLIAFVGSGIQYADNTPLFIANGIASGILFCIFYYALLQYNYAVIPIATAAYLVAWQLQEAFFNSFIHSFAIHLTASCVIVLASMLWYRTLNRHTGEIGNDV